jgi:hypothetical protein
MPGQSLPARGPATLWQAPTTAAPQIAAKTVVTNPPIGRGRAPMECRTGGRRQAQGRSFCAALTQRDRCFRDRAGHLPAAISSNPAQFVTTC